MVRFMNKVLAAPIAFVLLAASAQAPSRPHVVAVTPNSSISPDGCQVSILFDDFVLMSSGEASRTIRLRMSEGSSRPLRISAHLRGPVVGGRGGLSVMVGGTHVSRRVASGRRGEDYFASGTLRRTSTPSEFDLTVRARFRVTAESGLLGVDSVDLTLCT